MNVRRDRLVRFHTMIGEAIGRAGACLVLSYDHKAVVSYEQQRARVSVRQWAEDLFLFRKQAAAMFLGRKLKVDYAPMMLLVASGLSIEQQRAKLVDSRFLAKGILTAKGLYKFREGSYDDRRFATVLVRSILSLKLRLYLLVKALLAQAEKVGKG